ncbi:Methyltransferase domain family protein [Aspergillus niger]|uniref:Methyltransferase domain family protein n=1 Tax=Aspergillus niger TaxID=5061 RepID=A0A505ICN1_ASPNG|nr:Methyltransferase domain family protein [Aspergillus niger]
MKPALGFRSTKLNIGHICTVILPAYICFRYLMAVTSGIETQQSWVHTFPQMDTVNMTGSKEAENSRIKGTVTAIFNLGCLCSALSCILVGGILGRKRTFWLGLPGWLIKKGRIDDARNVLAKLRDEPIDSPSIVHQIEQIEMTLQETGQGSFKDIFEMDQHNSPTAPSSLLRYRWATDLWGQCDNFLSIYHIRNLSWHE